MFMTERLVSWGQLYYKETDKRGSTRAHRNWITDGCQIVESFSLSLLQTRGYFMESVQ